MNAFTRCDRRAASPETTRERFPAIPTRLYLDSSILQTLLRYGDFIFENVDPPEDDRAHGMPGFVDDLEALRRVIQLVQRANFDVVVSDATMQEVADKDDPHYLRWGLELLAHWRERINEYGGCVAFDGTGAAIAPRLDHPSFGCLSVKDKALLRDAVALECDAFLTMEKKLPKNAPAVARAVGLHVLRPPDYWSLLRPWAALWI